MYLCSTINCLRLHLDGSYSAALQTVEIADKSNKSSFKTISNVLLLERCEMDLTRMWSNNKPNYRVLQCKF